MKSSSHGRFTSAIPISFRFTLNLFLIITLAVPAAITFAKPLESITKIFLRSAVDRVAPAPRWISQTITLAISDPAPRTVPYAEDFSLLAHSSTTYPAGWSGAQVGAGGSAGSSSTFKTIEGTADLNLTANSSASTSAGAVHNFNGKVGSLSTGSADPSLVLAIDTTGQTDVNIAFDVMTIRNPYNGTTNTRISEVDLQYRICSTLPCSGAFATASVSPGIYQNNTTTQTTGTSPQKSETKMIALPVVTNNQANVQLRWVQRDVSGTGARPSFAVDNVSITGAPACTAPAVTLEPANQSVTYGASAVSFDAAASGDPIPSVQWEVDTGSGFVTLLNGGGVSGVDTTTLTIAVPDVSMTGNMYRAVFTNGCGEAPSATSPSAALSVAPLLITVSPDAGQVKVYGDADPVLTHTYEPSPAFSDTFSGELSRDAGETPGSYNITQGTLSLGSNYDLVFTSGVPFAITPKVLVAEIVADDKIYDGTTAAIFSCSLSGVIAPHAVNCSGGTAAFASDNVGVHTVAAAGLSLDGADSGNYSLPLTTAIDTAEIFVRAIDVTAAADTKVYDGNQSSDEPPVIGAPGIAIGDTASFVQSYQDRNAGTNKTLNASGTVNDGNGGNNYAINFISSLTGVITSRPITVTAVSATKVLDGNASSNGIPTVVPPLVDGDTANFIQTYDTPSAGTGKTLTPSGIAVDGNSGLNYSYTFVPVHTGVITAAGYCFDGYLAPIGGFVENGNGGTFADPVRAFKLNSTIPIKFMLYAGACGVGSPITTGMHTLQMIKYANAVDSEPAIDATPTDAATTGNQFRLVGTEWHYNLDTKRTPGITAGTWLVKAILSDGSQKTVWISIKK